MDVLARTPPPSLSTHQPLDSPHRSSNTGTRLRKEPSKELQKLKTKSPSKPKQAQATPMSSRIISQAGTPTSTTPVSSGPVLASGSIINQKADASRSLFQVCVGLHQRLALVPGFDKYLPRLDPTNPVESLWAVLRLGEPLFVIFNALQPKEILDVSVLNVAEAKKPKQAVFLFLQACMKELEIPSSEVFQIGDIINYETGVKNYNPLVPQIITLVLDKAQERGFLYAPKEHVASVENKKLSYRDHVINEIVQTERKFVQDLENLNDLKTFLEQKAALPGDTLHQIFLNVHTLLNSQRNFLIRVETVNSLPAPTQRWGQLFVENEAEFDKFMPFIANQRKANNATMAVIDRIQALDHPVANDVYTVNNFLLKPMQRLTKYPLLLRELVKKDTEATEEQKRDYEVGIEVTNRVLTKANEVVHADLLEEAFDDLVRRVEDWRGHVLSQFGKLHMQGIFPVVTSRMDAEREYEIYLFDSILLCCKESPATKNSRGRARTPAATPVSAAGGKARNASRLQLKGRIFMSNVFRIAAVAKGEASAIQIWWKTDEDKPEGEYFTIQFRSEEVMNKWHRALEVQRQVHELLATQNSIPTPPASAPAQSGDYSQDFNWNNGPTPTQQQQQQQLHSRSMYGYGEETGGNDDDSVSPHHMGSFPGNGMPRNASSSSLRQRSGEGFSRAMVAPRFGGSIHQMPPPLSHAMSGLSIQTNRMGQPLNDNMPVGDSYFSPSTETPASRSSSSGYYSGYFPPSSNTASISSVSQLTDDANGQHHSNGNGNNRYTAPAMRVPSNDGMHRGHASLPSSAAQPQRNRSYSTPDMNGQAAALRRNTSGANVPAVPGIPAHIQQDNNNNNNNLSNRSHTSSPRHEGGSSSASGYPPPPPPMPPHGVPYPSGPPQRMPYQTHAHHHSGSMGGHMVQFPGQPMYRQGTPNGSVGRKESMDSGRWTPASSTMSGPPSGGVSASFAYGQSTTTSSSFVPDLSPPPQQLRVRVKCETGAGLYFTLVVPVNTTYQSLVDRIDNKLTRLTSNSIGKGSLKLYYRDEDDDLVVVESDDDVNMALTDGVAPTSDGSEVELYCTGDFGAPPSA